MPIYEYECLVCGKKSELLQRHDDMPLTACHDCGGLMKKLMSNTSFVLKGTGWYKTDYASPQSEKTVTPDKDCAASSEKKAEKKPEAAAKTE